MQLYGRKKGSGFDQIEADYSPFGEVCHPYISSDASSFTLTLPDLTWRGGIFENSDELPDVYTETILSGKKDIHILAFCFRNAHTAKEIAEEPGIKPSTYFRQSVLSRLVSSGFLKQIHGEKPLYICQIRIRYFCKTDDRGSGMKNSAAELFRTRNNTIAKKPIEKRNAV